MNIKPAHIMCVLKYGDNYEQFNRRSCPSPPLIAPEEDNREQEHSWKCDKAHLKLIAPHDHYRKHRRIL